MQRLNLGKRLAIGFAAILALLLIVAVAAGRGVTALNEDLRVMYEDRAVPIEQLGEVTRLLLRNRVLVMDMMAFPSADNLAKRDTELKQNIEQVGKIWGQFSQKRMSAEIRGDADAFISLRKSYVADGLIPIRDAMLASKPDEARRIYQETLSPVAAKVAAALSKLVSSQIAEGRAEFERSRAEGRSLLMLTIALTSAAALLGAFLAWAITRSITRPLAQALDIAETVARGDLTSRVEVTTRDETGRLLSALGEMVKNLVHIVGTVRTSSESIATGSTQIATGNTDLSQRTEEQASNLQQTAASMEQLSGTVKSNAETARQAAQLAASASDVASRGGAVVGKVVSTMDAISESSKKIADIIGVIDGIAFQTNILALNAAVEAARAGDQGRGFAVVAGEVRSLARRSADAAKEIKDLIGTSVERVEAGSRLVQDAGSTMEDITSQVRQVAALIGEISTATAEQTAGIGQICDAVSQLDRVTQQNSALVEESAAAADSLNQQAGKLVETVRAFRLDAS
nr:methyl-accepting chemotaxis protein [Aquabacterium terrae]